MDPFLRISSTMQRMDQTTLAQGLRERLQQRDTLQAHQRPPADPTWAVWVLLAGRGAGKSYAGMRWLNDQAQALPGLRARVIAPTFGDGVASCVDGPNGLLALSNNLAKWNPSAAGGAVVTYPNGSKIWIVGTPSPREVDRLRALTNIEIDVFEEAFANPCFQQAWDQARLSRRSTRIATRAVVTSTPRPHPIIKKWEKDERVHISRAISRDNKYADADWLAELEKTYKGTRLYRQEVLGEVVEDVEGALWKLIDIERSKFTGDRAALLAEIGTVMVGVDPPSGQGTCGIVVVGRDDSGHIYVLDDYSITEALPNQWALRVNAAVEQYGGIVVAEVNQGGEMVKAVLREAAPDLPITTVNAAKGKKTRAEPVAQRWEAEYQTAHMAFPSEEAGRKLILQLTETSWDADGKLIGESPDILDAMVWAATKLKTGTTATIRSSSTTVVSSSTDPTVSAFKSLLRGGFPGARR